MNTIYYKQKLNKSSNRFQIQGTKFSLDKGNPAPRRSRRHPLATRPSGAAEVVPPGIFSSRSD